jgi:ribosomal protection tetracycline resistance protein
MLIFVNKIDRVGARGEPLLDDIRRKLNVRVVAMNAPEGLGERTARVAPCDRATPDWCEPVIDLLAETSERVIEEFERTGGDLCPAFIDAEFRAQVASRDVVPVYFGSAVTGVGIDELLAGVAEWLPTAEADPVAPPSATVFKITRRAHGEKLVYARVFSGHLATRQRVVLQRRDKWGEVVQIEERITAIDCFESGTPSRADAACAGEIAVLHGLRAARIGDRIGNEAMTVEDIAPAFPPPALESVVYPVDPADIPHLRSALEQLAEQDPLMSLRQRTEEGEISIRLYGEVQKEVVTDMLAREYGIAVAFGPSQTICIERVTGSGDAFEIIGEDGNPFYGTVGFRIEPGAAGTGVRYHRELGALPPAFYRAIEETVYETLSQGLCGWAVTDCVVNLTHAGYWSPVSTAGDFRKLVPLVLMEALRIAGTEVCEPLEELELDIPEDTFGAVCGALLTARATLRHTLLDGASYRLTCDIPTVELPAVEQHLPGLTRGDGGWSSTFAGYVPVSGDVPVRARIGPNPLNRAHYLAEVARL